MTLPPAFVDMVSSFGSDYAQPLLQALTQSKAPVSVRVNTLKGIGVRAGAPSVPWHPQGFYLDERPVFAADPAWHQGLYYVQDASSMVQGFVVKTIVDRYFAGIEPLRYLDACAAPGGKTIAALESLPATALVVANEYDRHRSNILLENLAKSGAPNVVVSRGDACKYSKLQEEFDIIAVDAPCSGEGMMRKDEQAVKQWSPALIADCARTQEQITDALFRAIKPGGIMIYSTCTFNASENEKQLERLIEEFGAESIDLGLEQFDGVFKGFDTDAHCYRFAPGHVRGEGLFISVLRKPGKLTATSEKSKTKAPGQFALQHVLDSELYSEVNTGSKIILRPAAHDSFIQKLASKVDLIRSGLHIATIKGRDTIPTQTLALSSKLNTESFANLELNYTEAMSYLHGDSLSDIDSELPKGFVLVTYDGHPLGFVKNIGRRANNLYPEAMRLRLDQRTLPPIPPTVI